MGEDAERCAPSRCDLPRCWQCGSGLPLAYFGGVCPYCNASLTSADYDATATELFERTQALYIRQREASDRKSAVTKRLDSFRNKHRILFRIVSHKAKKRIGKVESAYNAVTKELNRSIANLEDHAAARYYASQWFKETRMVLGNTASDNGTEPFRKATYLPDGLHHLRILKNRRARGLLGECIVFDIISSAIESGELGNACILPSIFVTSSITSSKNYRRTYAEIDMLLITQRAAYVIETKNLFGRILCVYKRKAKEYKVYVMRLDHHGREDVPRKEDNGPYQNQRHLETLAKTMPELSGNLNNVVCYIDNVGFDAPRKQGANRTFLTTSSVDSSANILKIIKEIESNLPQIRTEAEIASLAEFMKDAYLDKDGSKRKEHAARLREDNRAWSFLKGI